MVNSQRDTLRSLFDQWMTTLPPTPQGTPLASFLGASPSAGAAFSCEVEFPQFYSLAAKMVSEPASSGLKIMPVLSHAASPLAGSTSPVLSRVGACQASSRSSSPTVGAATASPLHREVAARSSLSVPSPIFASLGRWRQSIGEHSQASPKVWASSDGLELIVSSSPSSISSTVSSPVVDEAQQSSPRLFGA